MTPDDVRFINQRILLEEIKNSLPSKIGEVRVVADIVAVDVNEHQPPCYELSIQLFDPKGKSAEYLVKLATPEDILYKKIFGEE